MTTLMALSDLLCQQDGVSLSGLKPLMKRSFADAHTTRQFSQGDAFAFVVCKHVLTSVRVLLSHSRPSAITRLVIAIIVNAIDRGARRSRPHVGIELREVVSPLWSHGYSTPSVNWVLRILRVVAPVFCVLPASKFRTAFVILRVSVRCGCESPTLCAETAATEGGLSKFLRHGHGHSSAVTLAIPSDMVVVRMRSRDDQQAPESLTDFVDRNSTHLSTSICALMIPQGVESGSP